MVTEIINDVTSAVAGDDHGDRIRPGADRGARWTVGDIRPHRAIGGCLLSARRVSCATTQASNCFRLASVGSEKGRDLRSDKAAAYELRTTNGRRRAFYLHVR